MKYWLVNDVKNKRERRNKRVSWLDVNTAGVAGDSCYFVRGEVSGNRQSYWD